MKKGFTLVEMIGIIVILSVILLVAVPATLRTIQNSNEKRNESFRDDLKLATESYIVKHSLVGQSPIQVTLEQLKKEHYIEDIPDRPNADPFESAGTDLTGYYVKAVQNFTTNVYSYSLCSPDDSCEYLS